ncbi:cytochrome b5 [Dacryopinax primogenitus]|uniref:Cytochrome b5 n=1 Tax=Dacryopinax primogenitus (strain DJM 731) TaxID=1858805 RepID=M5GE70_DACPD|nr:cytochrome b5 [Dacryopinax primogenitus]EJU05132.1 cytochrome b5 [Dacryopinax primogenitus]
MPPPPVPTNGGLRAAVKAQKKAIKRQLREALAPGHSQMDWAILKTKGLNLRGTENILRVTPSTLAAHTTKEDAWSCFFGKVYNLTPYFSYHPGGERKLLRVAGKDGTRLFVHSHEWINVEAMMDECFVGYLVPEPERAEPEDD